jgi:hypothetical protein
MEKPASGLVHPLLLQKKRKRAPRRPAHAAAAPPGNPSNHKLFSDILSEQLNAAVKSQKLRLLARQKTVEFLDFPGASDQCHAIQSGQM